MNTDVCESKYDKLYLIVYDQHNSQNFSATPVAKIDWENGTLVWDTKSHLNTGTEVRVWRGFEDIIALPDRINGECLEELEKKIQPLLDEIAAEEFFSKWDGNNNVGNFTQKGEELKEKIEQILADADELPDEQGCVWAAGDWLDGTSLKSEFGLSANTTAAEIEKLEEKITSNAYDDGVIIFNLEEYLLEKRNKLAYDLIDDMTVEQLLSLAVTHGVCNKTIQEALASDLKYCSDELRELLKKIDEAIDEIDQ